MQVRKEVEAAIDWVKKCAENWPEVEWEKKDLESLCVIVPNRHVVSYCVSTQEHRCVQYLDAHPVYPCAYIQYIMYASVFGSIEHCDNLSHQRYMIIRKHNYAYLPTSTFRICT